MFIHGSCLHIVHRQSTYKHFFYHGVSVSKVCVAFSCLLIGVYCKGGQWWATSGGNNTWYDFSYWVSVLQLTSLVLNSATISCELCNVSLVSSYRYYVSLQKIYQAKAEFDCLALEHHVKEILKRIGRDPDSISRAYIKTFCKNSRKLRVSCFF